MDNTSFSTQRLDHLGIVAGICDRIDLANQINSYVGPTRRSVSIGHAVKAMILNALGFVGRPLYLTPEFFDNKPVELLLGSDFTASDFNDDSLGRALDTLHDNGLTECFAFVSSHALAIFEIGFDFAHLDSTSFSLHGKYPSAESNTEVITIGHGYSKDRRPDLKQAVVNLICTYQSSIPVWLQSLDGNSSDKTSFPEIIQAYVEQMKTSASPIFICDSALYSAENVMKLSKVKWIARVPETIGEVKTLYRQISLEQMEPAEEKGYHYLELGNSYGNINQRWLIVHSEAAEQRELKTLRKRIRKECETAQESLEKLSRKEFESPEQAKAELETLEKSWRFHQTTESQLETVAHYKGRGRPKANRPPDYQTWKIRANVDENRTEIEKEQSAKGKFILATNELETDTLSTQQILTAYKAQASSVERGFRFLKDPMFFADSLFLDKPERIMALLMIMGLALLVYALAEHVLRTELVQRNQTLPNQVGKPTQKLTMRRTFQLFEGIDVLIIQQNKTLKQRVLNLKTIHYQIIELLGDEVKKYYLFDP